MSQLEDNRRKHDDLRDMVDESCLRVTDNTAKQVKDTARKAYYLGCRDGMELAREAVERALELDAINHREGHRDKFLPPPMIELLQGMVKGTHGK